MKISAVYRQKSLILITCAACGTTYPFDVGASETAADQPLIRKKSEQGETDR